MAKEDDKPVDRRKFFRLGLAELMGPLASMAKPPFSGWLSKSASWINLCRPKKLAADATSRSGGLASPSGPLVEQKFREQCSRCGECVRVCPAHAIQIDTSGTRGRCSFHRPRCHFLRGLRRPAMYERLPHRRIGSNKHQRYRHGRRDLAAGFMRPLQGRSLHHLHRSLPAWYCCHRIEK